MIVCCGQTGQWARFSRVGLDISVGNPAMGDDEGEQRYVAAFERLRSELLCRGIDAYREPESGPPAGAVRRCSGFSYSFLHYLRRVYALHYEGVPVTPIVSKEELAAARYHVDAATEMFASHLLCHSDTSGFYIPVDFDAPLFLSKEVLGGGIVGSSHGLLRELHEIAEAIGIRLSEGELGDLEAQGILDDAGHPYRIERHVWLALYDACTASIAFGNAVAFH